MKHVPWIWHYFPVGRSFRKSITLSELPSSPLNAWHLHRLEIGMSCCVREPRHPDRWPDSLCQNDTMSIRFSFQKLEPTKQCFYPQNERSQTLPVYMTGPFWENQARRNKRNMKAEKREHTRLPLSQFSRQGPQSKGPTLCELHNCPIFF